MARIDSLRGQLELLSPHLKDACSELFPKAGAEDTRCLIGGAWLALIKGFELHGSSLFRMSDDRLEDELRRELEDAIVYRAEQLRRREESLKPESKGVTP